MRRITALLLALAVVTPAGARATPEDLTSYVDPFIGTLGAGFVFPGPAAPYGMVQLSPDTDGYFAYTGYQWADRYIRGFSHVHTESMGVPEGGNVPFMPHAGAVVTDVRKYQQPFSHALETAQPGYYAVTLGSRVRAELTAGLRVGVHRYTFPRDAEASVLIDAGRYIAGSDTREFPSSRPSYAPSAIEIVGDDLVLGTANTAPVGNRQYSVHFAARFDRRFASFGTWSSPGAAPQPGARSVSATGAGAYVSFHFNPYDDAPVVVAEVGISFVSRVNALANLDAEMAGRHFGFSSVRAQTRAAWDDALHAIVVDGGTELDKRSFYTALYHAQHHPNVFNDSNGEYLGYDGKVHRIGAAGDPMPAGSTYYANYSFWDTYRAEMPLLMLIAPDRVRDMMRSLAAIAVQGGRIPRWGWMNRYADFMNGEPGLQVFADAFCRGLVPGDSLPTLYANARALALDLAMHRDPVYLENGYVPYPGSGASSTLEHAIGDFALALVADRLGATADRDDLLARAGSWRNLFDDGTRLLRPRRADGSWAGNAALQGAAYVPESDDGWREGTGWQYTWLVPHDARGLFDAMGAAPYGGDVFVGLRLDGFFAAAAAPYAGPEAQQKLTLYGIAYAGNQYAPSNEHDLQAPWLYDWVAAWKGQALQRSLQTLYRATPDGLPGNDDLGTMSAWFVWSALGFYPPIPGAPVYVTGSPMFERASIRTPGGAVTVEAPGASLASKYVTSLKIDGGTVDGPWFTHAAFHPGGSIRFEMSPAPSPLWGTGAPPPSQSASQLAAFACAG